MKIVHVITGLNQGGAEGALRRLILGSEDPCQHSVISLMGDGVHGAELRAKGVRIVTLYQKPGRFSFCAFQHMRSVLREIQPDVIQTWMYHSDFLGGIVARLAGIPVIWGIRRSDESLRDLGWSTWLLAKCSVLFLRRIPSVIISCSRRAIDTHRRFGYPNHFVYIPNGFEVQELASREVRPQGFPGDGNTIYGHVARVHPCKGHALFLDAFAQATDGDFSMRAVMVGTNVSEGDPKLRSIIGPRRIVGVSFLGARSDIADIMRAIDVFVLSSVGEGFPNVVAEAMMQGTPCIVTDVGDAAEIVGDTGWVVPPNNVSALADAMCQAAMLSKQELQQKGMEARQRIIDNYSIKKMVNGFEQVWQQAINGKKSCAE